MTAHVCVWIPDWPLAAAIAEGTVTAQEAAAVHDGKRIVAVSPAARRAGVRRGMRRRLALSYCPELRVLHDDPAQQMRAFEAVLAGIEQVLALPVVIRPGLVMAAAAGPVKHCGGQWSLVEELTAAVVDIAGGEAYAGIGQGALAAVLAARSQLVVPSQQTPAFLAPQPVSSIGVVAADWKHWQQLQELSSTLARFGIRTLGQLAELDRGQVATRFGRSGLFAHDLASGCDVLLAQQQTEGQDVSVQQQWDPPLEQAGAAAFACRSLAQRLIAHTGGRGCEELVVRARTTAGTICQRSWALGGLSSVGELHVRAITDRVRWQLDGWLSSNRLDGPLDFLEITARAVYRHHPSGPGLWGAYAQQEEAERTITRLQSLCGPAAVHIVVPRGGRHPARRAVTVPAICPPEEQTTAGPWAGRIPGLAPSIVFSQPLDVRLYDDGGQELAVPPTADDFNARPACYRLDASGVEQATYERALRYLATQGQVTDWAGPWLLWEQWWEGRPPRICLQLVIDHGALLIGGTPAGRWQIEGCYG